MRNRFIFSLVMSVLIAVSPVTIAQEGANSVPGLQIRSQLLTAIDNGTPADEATVTVSNEVLAEGSVAVPAASLPYLQTNQPAFESMVGLLVNNATGFELAIAGFGALPEQPSDVVTIAMILFPEDANEIYNIALQTGVISAEDALLAAINAGIDTSTLTATAAGATGNNVSPLGVGTGAAGAGGGDTTVSAN
ncbi:hypothetical protein Q4561_10515 [Alteromonas sp. 1_MG-2023]|uniref:hypothetical protein n=1 Tax=Alteromonas sp. 1_MG-2023 TaxID=3062669 RepID=UPI0026E3EC1B|nr:hypothetical protein [Alteromonas sp. 1_MG-2023]MDO6567490.1 hypothetical protein [Alteromonas sp. 1_MG-2023]